MNSILKTSLMTRESSSNQKPSCLFLQVHEHENQVTLDSYDMHELSGIKLFPCLRYSDVSWRGSGSYGALSHHSDSAEEV